MGFYICFWDLLVLPISKAERSPDWLSLEFNRFSHRPDLPFESSRKGRVEPWFQGKVLC